MKGILKRLYPYQRRWFNDQSLFKIGLWARQTGKDFTCTAEAALHCASLPNQHWLILACGERQACESLAKARDWSRLISMDAGKFGSGRARVLRESATEVRWENGSRITALPAKAGTIRGYSAHVILTEFAFHDDPEAIWKAIFPSVSNSLRGGPKRLRIITTPNGQGDFFHRLWSNSDLFSKHRVTIHDATKDGLPMNLKQLRSGILDAEAWAQEYECEFLDHSAVLLPYELIESCEAREATETADDLSRRSGELFVGIDFGRKSDLTVCWVLERVGAELWTREVLTLERMPTPAQFEALAPRVARARQVCVDYTGAGIGLGDLLAEQFAPGLANTPGAKIELCSFTALLKQEVFSKLRAAFERRKVWIPRSAAIREDLHAMHRVVSPNGQITYRASHTADGHSDRCVALALALRAAENAPVTACASSIGVKLKSLARRR
jgi:phage FluMu gp28-like protein